MARTARLASLRLIPVAGVALALALSGCAAGQISQTAQQVAAIDGANGKIGALNVLDVRIAATEDGSYAAGADLPLKLWISNAALKQDALTSVSSPAADAVNVTGTAEFAGQTLVPIGEDTDVTITLSGLKEELPYGHSIPVTFSFKQAGDITVNVPIEIPTERESEARDTVNVLPAEEGNIWFGEEGHEGSESGSESRAETSAESTH